MKTCNIIKCGEYYKLLEYIKNTKLILRSFNDNEAENIANDLEILKLPRNQKLINNVLIGGSFIEWFIRLYNVLKSAGYFIIKVRN